MQFTAVQYSAVISISLRCPLPTSGLHWRDIIWRNRTKLCPTNILANILTNITSDSGFNKTSLNFRQFCILDNYQFNITYWYFNVGKRKHKTGKPAVKWWYLVDQTRVCPVSKLYSHNCCNLRPTAKRIQRDKFSGGIERNILANSLFTLVGFKD